MRAGWPLSPHPAGAFRVRRLQGCPLRASQTIRRRENSDALTGEFATACERVRNIEQIGERRGAYRTRLREQRVVHPVRARERTCMRDPRARARFRASDLEHDDGLPAARARSAAARYWPLLTTWNFSFASRWSHSLSIHMGVLPFGMAAHSLDVDAIERPVQLLRRELDHRLMRAAESSQW